MTYLSTPIPLDKNLALTFLYFLISLFGILNHEIWLDEAHHWLLARDSTSILDLFNRSRYEGHPIFWNLLLYFVSRLTSNPIWMQVLHIGISTLAVYIFLSKSKFRFVWKLMFIFGYFMLFEYNLLSRNYMLGVLFIFIACALFPMRKRKYIFYVVALGLAANAHAIFLVVSSCIMLIDLVQWKQLPFSRSKLISWGIYLIFLSLAIADIVPPSDTLYFNGITATPLSQKFTYGIKSLYSGLFTIPDFQNINFWNTNLILSWFKPLAILLTIVAYLLPIFLFYKNKALLISIYFGILAAQVFFFVTQLNSVRYDGMLFILIFSGLWIDHNFKFQPNKLNTLYPESTLKTIRNTCIWGILSFQLVGGLFSYFMDIRHPFDQAKNVVVFLKEYNLQGKEIVTFSCQGTPLSAYLEKKVTFLCTSNEESYCLWSNPCRMRPVSVIQLKDALNELSRRESFIFISDQKMNEQVSAKSTENPKLKPLGVFNGSILKHNDYFIYEVTSRQ